MISEEKKIVQFCWEQLLQITNAHNCKKNLECIQFNIFCLSKKMSCVADADVLLGGFLSNLPRERNLQDGRYKSAAQE